MKDLSKTKLRHLQEKLEHIQKRDNDRIELMKRHNKELTALSGHTYGSAVRAKLLVKHSAELREFTITNVDFWEKMTLRHQEELSMQHKIS